MSRAWAASETTSAGQWGPVLHPVPMTAVRKAEVSREAWRLRCTTFGRFLARKHRLERLEI